MSSFLIEHLTIKDDDKTIVDLLSKLERPLNINRSLALVGQSGSGKSLTIKTILDLLPNNLTSTFEYNCDFELSFQNIGFIPQNPFTSLSPMTKIYKQFFLEESKIDDLLKMVELDKKIKYRFPSELSGGQLQRVVIAIALSKEPKLLLLDEPTTALDTNSKKIVLDILQKLQKELNFKMIFISHDIDSIENICEDIAIIKDGTINEYGKMEHILTNPKESYTISLLESNFKNREFRV